jgi:hypothetical protein
MTNEDIIRQNNDLLFKIEQLTNKLESADDMLGSYKAWYEKQCEEKKIRLQLIRDKSDEITLLKNKLKNYEYKETIIKTSLNNLLGEIAK